mmetsp:Transcript_18440/g.44439  ORF Transcript_18440/g.44439 Transcript_18440/m.44439 type:complete len:213 (-) Transcript_18440:38-676(-)
MSFLFGGTKKTPAELIKENKRLMDRSQREIEREITKLKQDEKKVIADIKKHAKDGQMGPVKILAKNLVRVRGQVSKFYNLKTQLQSIGLQLAAIKSTQAMTDSIKGAMKAMRAMNKMVDMPKMQAILKEFEKQNEMMGEKQEMMDEAMDEMFEGDDEENAAEDIIGQVLAEIGIDFSEKMGVASAATPNLAGAAETDSLDVDIEERLKNLKQ